MNETGSELRGWTRRNFLKAAGIAGCAMLFPWLAYAAESDELNAKADEMKAKLDSLQTQYNEALERYNTANDAHEAAVAAMDAAQQRIDEAQSLIESTRNQLAKRANSIYREGSMSMIDVIFGSQSFDDFVTNWDSVERISQQDAALVQQNKDAKAEAEAAHAEYSKQEKVAAEELANAKAAKEELETAQAALQKQYDDMNSDISARRGKKEGRGSCGGRPKGHSAELGQLQLVERLFRELFRQRFGLGEPGSWQIRHERFWLATLHWRFPPRCRPLEFLRARLLHGRRYRYHGWLVWHGRHRCYGRPWRRFGNVVPA